MSTRIITRNLKTVFFYLLLHSQLANTGQTFSDSANLSDTDSDSTDACTSCSGTSMVPASDAEGGHLSDPLTSTAIPTLCVLGVFGNLITLLVWSSAPDFNASVFFMKGLAVFEILFLLVNFINCFLDKRADTPEKFIIVCLQLYCPVVITFTTLALVFTRWVAVYRPMEVTTLLPKRRVVLMYVVVQLCGVLGTSTTVSIETVVVFTINYTLFLALPILVTVCLNVSLVSKVCVHRANSTLGQQQQQQQQSAQAARSSQLHRMVAAVVCVSVITVLAYPVSLALHVIDAFMEPISNHLMNVINMLESFNSSINVVFYLAFASQFRQLFRQRVRRLFCRQDQPYATSAM